MSVSIYVRFVLAATKGAGERLVEVGSAGEWQTRSSAKKNGIESRMKTKLERQRESEGGGERGDAVKRYVNTIRETRRGMRRILSKRDERTMRKWIETEKRETVEVIILTEGERTEHARSARRGFRVAAPRPSRLSSTVDLCIASANCFSAALSRTEYQTLVHARARKPRC